MPVAFLAGACESGAASRAAALASRGGLLGLLASHRQPRRQWGLYDHYGHYGGGGGGPVLQPLLLRALILPLAVVLLQLLVHRVVLPAMAHPQMPFSAVLGHGVCADARGVWNSGVVSGGSYSGSSSDLAGSRQAGQFGFSAGDATAVGGGGSSRVQGGGGVLWLLFGGLLRVFLSVFEWGLGRFRARLLDAVCRLLAELCDGGTGLQSTDCAALFAAGP